MRIKYFIRGDQMKNKKNYIYLAIFIILIVVV
ncbi:unnamed protein product, partial [marine sediment metagenome]